MIDSAVALARSAWSAWMPEPDPPVTSATAGLPVPEYTHATPLPAAQLPNEPDDHPIYRPHDRHHEACRAAFERLVSLHMDPKGGT